MLHGSHRNKCSSLGWMYGPHRLHTPQQTVPERGVLLLPFKSLSGETMCIIILSMGKVKRFSKLSSEIFLVSRPAAAMPPHWAEKAAAKADMPVRPHTLAHPYRPKKRQSLWKKTAAGKKQERNPRSCRTLAAKHAQGGRGIRKPQKCNSASKIIQIVNKKERRGIKTPSGRKAAAHDQRRLPHT